MLTGAVEADRLVRLLRHELTSRLGNDEVRRIDVDIRSAELSLDALAMFLIAQQDAASRGQPPATDEPVHARGPPWDLPGLSILNVRRR